MKEASQTVIVGDGLTKDILSLEHPYQTSKSNVGRREIERLMGRGKAFGDGPLPSFLREAIEARSRGAAVQLVLLKDEEGAGASELVDPLSELAESAVVIPTASDVIPWKALVDAFGDAVDPTGASEATFLVLGCHTEKRVLAIATFLRNVLGLKKVAVSSHLVGSATQDAHFATLRHNLPGAGVRVFLDLAEAASYAGLDSGTIAALGCEPCGIEPADIRNKLEGDQKTIIELLCMHWTLARLRALAGGFSGSLLFVADGWKGSARTEPMVLKVDDFTQMRRELDGYHQVKDFFGKNVPTFGYPVIQGDYLGVGMELAAMEGNPRTLQDSFEAAESEETLARFMLGLEKALRILSEKLYSNTRELSWLVPYRSFGLHAEKQQQWLRQNGEIILSYLDPDIRSESTVNPEQLAKLLRLIASNGDGIDSEICQVHGDLNLANVICDDGDNIWFIDWTHSGYAPVELDFAKLENDVKFVMTKEFDAEDLARLKPFEEYLLAQRLPAEPNGLPDSLKFVKWDLRFRKILEAVRKIRQTCFDLKVGDDWIAYRVALLRYALHTLSFDKRRGQGECEPPQLMHALFSVEGLVYNLVADDFHLRIRAERPASYPPRQRISIDESPWVLDCEEYNPPYYVAPEVLENDRSVKPDGWADPEKVQAGGQEWNTGTSKHRDDEGRPLNPRGRTGIVGRGLLGRWGANASVAAAFVRTHAESGFIEILLGSKEDRLDLSLPKGFVLPDESSDEAVSRVLERESGFRPDSLEGVPVFDGYTFDPRQTDHAWVESRSYLFSTEADAVPGRFEAGGEFDEVKWWPFDAKTVNRVPSGQARSIRESLTKLMEMGRIDKSLAEKLLAAT